MIHTCALAYELGFEPSKVLETFDKYSTIIPHIAKVDPASLIYDCEDLYKAGGIPEVMKVIRPYLHTDVMTATMQTLGENLDKFVSAYPPNPDLIRPSTTLTAVWAALR